VDTFLLLQDTTEMYCGMILKLIGLSLQYAEHSRIKKCDNWNSSSNLWASIYAEDIAYRFQF